MFAAHIREDGVEQSLDQHLSGVASLCTQSGNKLKLSSVSRLVGIMHDFGKYTDAFNTYIHYSHSHHDDHSLKGKIPHSLQGAIYLHERFAGTSPPSLAIVTAALSIASHHCGLIDCVSPDGGLHFYKQLRREEPKFHYTEARDNFLRNCTLSDELDGLSNQATTELHSLMQRMREQRQLTKFSIHLVVRLIFSCLIDADRYDTYCFTANVQPKPFLSPDWAILLQRLEEYIHQKNPAQISPEEVSDALHIGGAAGLSPENLSRLRAAISLRCREAAKRPVGIYRLNVPTGGGKTLSSLRFALAHALEHNKDRIIYIIPYTTIIDQNAAVIREVLGEDAHILEHHSSVLPDQQPYDEDYQLLTQRWDSPVILTTMVQFLNTLFAGGTRAARRMHSLCNSVLIFDEIQSLPINCISLFNRALNFLCGICNVTAILCTATQPLLSGVSRPLLLSEYPELVPEAGFLFRAFKRTRIINACKPGGYTAELLADFFMQYMEGLRTGLAVLNTKKDARALYCEILKQNDLLPAAERYSVFLLSTDLCPAHRRSRLETMLNVMQTGRVLCVSTQLIEAGVDISFQLAIRALCGLDSIAQTAGRCNRNAEAALRNVYIVNIAGESLKNLPEIQFGQNATKYVLDCGRFDCDTLLSPEATDLYYSMYYTYVKTKMDYPLNGRSGLSDNETLYNLLGDNKIGRAALPPQTGNLPPLVQAFGTAGSLFEAIENNTTALLVPHEKGKILIQELRRCDLHITRRREMLRDAQQYCVNIFDYTKKKLMEEGAIQPLPDGVLALDKRFYSNEYGVVTTGENMELLDY